VHHVPGHYGARASGLQVVIVAPEE
jgi:hypothetical protein